MGSVNFTPEQEAIFQFVRNGHGNAIIDAVAGAGKTTTIMECARYVPNQRDALFCAFNRSIAAEIKSKFTDRGLPQITTKTIHALGLQILNDNNRSASRYTVDMGKSRNILRIPSVEGKMSGYRRTVLEVIKRNLKPDEYKEQLESYNFQEVLIDIYAKFRLTLCQNTSDDFCAMVNHFGIFNSIVRGMKGFDQLISAYLEAIRLLLQVGQSLAKEEKNIDFEDMLFLPYV